MENSVISIRLKKAHWLLKDVETSIESSITVITAANSLYYALFSAVWALLYAEDRNTKTHKGAGLEFQRLVFEAELPFTKNDVVLLATVANFRTDVDYNDFFTIEMEDLKKKVPLVKELIYRISQYIESKHGYLNSPFSEH